MNLGDACDKAKTIITGERLDQYGKPEDSFQIIADYWNVFLVSKKIIIEDSYELDRVDVAEMLTLFKIAREANQHKVDNYVDAIGYLDIACSLQEQEDK